MIFVTLYSCHITEISNCFAALFYWFGAVIISLLFTKKVNVVSPAFTMVATVLLTKRLSHIFSIDFNAFTFS